MLDAWIFGSRGAFHSYARNRSVPDFGSGKFYSRYFFWNTYFLIISRCIWCVFNVISNFFSKNKFFDYMNIDKIDLKYSAFFRIAKKSRRIWRNALNSCEYIKRDRMHFGIWWIWWISTRMQASARRAGDDVAKRRAGYRIFRTAEGTDSTVTRREYIDHHMLPIWSMQRMRFP